MSIRSLCPACMVGEHDKHVRDWNIRPGLIGGAWCHCELDAAQCADRAQRGLEKIARELFGDGLAPELPDV